MASYKDEAEQTSDCSDDYDDDSDGSSWMSDEDDEVVTSSESTPNVSLSYAEFDGKPPGPYLSQVSSDKRYFGMDSGFPAGGKSDHAGDDDRIPGRNMNNLKQGRKGSPDDKSARLNMLLQPRELTTNTENGKSGQEQKLDCYYQYSRNDQKYMYPKSPRDATSASEFDEDTDFSMLRARAKSVVVRPQSPKVADDATRVAEVNKMMDDILEAQTRKARRQAAAKTKVEFHGDSTATANKQRAIKTKPIDLEEDDEEGKLANASKISEKLKRHFENFEGTFGFYQDKLNMCEKPLKDEFVKVKSAIVPRKDNGHAIRKKYGIDKAVQCMLSGDDVDDDFMVDKAVQAFESQMHMETRNKYPPMRLFSCTDLALADEQKQKSESRKYSKSKNSGPKVPKANGNTSAAPPRKSKNTKRPVQLQAPPNIAPVAVARRRRQPRVRRTGRRPWNDSTAITPSPYQLSNNYY